MPHIHERLAGLRHRGGIAAAVVSESIAIGVRAAPAIRGRFPYESFLPGAKEEKVRKGIAALNIFEANFRFRAFKKADESAEQEDIQRLQETRDRYLSIFGDPNDPKRGEHNGQAFWDVKYLGKGWNSFSISFQTTTGKWVFKRGNPLSPNPYFFIDESNPAHSEEMQLNIENLKAAAAKAGLDNFVPEPQEIAYLPIPERLYRTEGITGSEPAGITMHVMPFVEKVSARELRHVRKKQPELFEYLLSELDQLAQIRRNLQEETLSELDLNGGGNVDIVWKIDKRTGQRYPGIQIIDAGLRYYGLETHITDAYFDLTGFLRGVQLRRRARGKLFQGLGSDLQAEWRIMENGERIRATLNEGSRRARRIEGMTEQPNSPARRRRGAAA